MEREIDTDADDLYPVEPAECPMHGTVTPIQVDDHEECPKCGRNVE